MGCRILFPQDGKVQIWQPGDIFLAGRNVGGFWYYVNPETVGEYTGLTDSNALEIFEGDCVQIPDSGIIGVVRYGEYQQPYGDGSGGHIGFYVDWISEESKNYSRRDLGYWNERAEIIGNIHDNPELLSGVVM